MGDSLAVVAFLALVGERLTEALIAPLFARFKWDQFYLRYAAWALCSLLVAATEVNLFAGYIPNHYAGWALTAVVAGGGANFLHDLFGAIGAAKVGADRNVVRYDPDALREMTLTGSNK